MDPEGLMMSVPSTEPRRRRRLGFCSGFGRSGGFWEPPGALLSASWPRALRRARSAWCSTCTAHLRATRRWKSRGSGLSGQVAASVAWNQDVASSPLVTWQHCWALPAAEVRDPRAGRDLGGVYRLSSRLLGTVKPHHPCLGTRPWPCPYLGGVEVGLRGGQAGLHGDRKSTRLNSSH